jgi:uncharacterized UBP type Zn finger protein
MVFANMAQQRLISPAFLGDICERGVRGPKDCSEFAMSLLDAVCAASSGKLAVKLHELIRFEIRHIISSSDGDEHMVDPPFTILVLHGAGVSSLQDALTLYFERRPLDPESQRTETLWMQALPKFLLIKIAREKLANDRSEKDSHSFRFPIKLDMTPYAYLHSQSFRYQLGSVVAHLGSPADGPCHYITFCHLSGRWICFNDSSVQPVSQHQAVEENFPERWIESDCQHAPLCCRATGVRVDTLSLNDPVQEFRFSTLRGRSPCFTDINDFPHEVTHPWSLPDRLSVRSG